MAIHPDDPPWSIFGLPRIITNGAALRAAHDARGHSGERRHVLHRIARRRSDNDLPAIARTLGERGAFTSRIAATWWTGTQQFHEAPHPSRFGDVHMHDVLTALRDVGFDGPMRPDHGRMIWGENGRPGYGLYDRALGATYLQGLWEGLERR